MKNGDSLYKLAEKLWPLNRSLAGSATNKTLIILKKNLPILKIKKIKSGTKVYDWEVPYEWEVKSAKVFDDKKNIIIDYNKNNLHLVTFSKSFAGILNNKSFKKKLFYLKNMPNAIPYRTSYYKKDWGFCISYNDYKKLNKKKYEVKINTKFKKGHMQYGEILIKGRSKKEFFFSTNICHPSLANNELSGPVVMNYIAKYLSQKNNNYSYRFVFIPETIGSIAYLFYNLKNISKNFLAGFNCVCLGYKKYYSYLPSKNNNSTANFLALETLKQTKERFKKYTWLDRGSDERQYSSPKTGLDFASLMTAKYGCYKEYHTSLDKLGTVVNSKGLFRGFKLIKNLIDNIEQEIFPVSNFIGEPQMGKRNLYPKIGGGIPSKKTKDLMNIISYCDGQTPSKLIADYCKIKRNEIKKYLFFLKKKKLINF